VRSLYCKGIKINLYKNYGLSDCLTCQEKERKIKEEREKVRKSEWILKNSLNYRNENKLN